jgi:hypothetical protein
LEVKALGKGIVAASSIKFSVYLELSKLGWIWSKLSGTMGEVIVGDGVV